jgi:hypothetical protein
LITVGFYKKMTNLHLERQLLSVHGRDFFRLGQNVLGQGSLHAVAGHDASVLGVGAPEND